MTAKGACYLLPLLLTACVIGPRLRDYDLARSPAGVMVTAAADGIDGTIFGELLAVNDSGIIVLRAGPQVVEVPFRLARHVSSHGPQPFRLNRGRVPDAPSIRHMSQRSRYPQGISPELMADLLRAYGQASVVRPGSP